MTHTISVNLNLKVTNEDIDDIMCSALEGGIAYWCSKANVVGEYLGEYASEQISRGGYLRIVPFDEDFEVILTREKFLKGIQKAIEGNYYSDYEWWNCNGIDTCSVDAEVADAIVQLALFSDVIYG